MKKIMFNDKYGLTQAVLEGRKTMTRRIVPECRALDILRLWERSEGAVATGYEEKTQSFRFDYCPDKRARISIDHLNLTPRYKVGEVVAVAQSYDSIIETLFANDEQWRLGYIKDVEDAHERLWRDILGRKNKMFVRADLMPHQIRIKNVRISRLQNISDEDCLKEGIYNWKDAPDCPTLTRKSNIELYGFDGVWDSFVSPRAAFAALIDKVSGKGTWRSNPWVFVYDFELLKLDDHE